MHNHCEASNLGLQQGNSQAGLEVSGLGAQVVVCDLGQATSFTKTHTSHIAWEQWPILLPDGLASGRQVVPHKAGLGPGERGQQ